MGLSGKFSTPKDFRLLSLPYRGNPILPIFLCSLLALPIESCSSPKTPSLSRPSGLEVGDKLVDFSLMDENGQIFKLSNLQTGWYLVIVLYRGDYCDACRTMLFNLKENYSLFTPQNITIAAISTDSVEESAHYNDQWRFPFPLLSDPSLRLIDAFGARHPNGHGIYDIAHPSILIVDPEKTIRYKKIANDPSELPNANEIISLIKGFKGYVQETPMPSQWPK